MYNYENEKAMARRIHGANHGENLVKAGGPVPAATPSTTGIGWSTGLDQSGPKLSIYDNKISAAQPARTQDSELLIQKLDELVEHVKVLYTHAEQRLGRFTPEAKADGDAGSDCKMYACESSYFRILESRYDTVKYYLELVNSIVGQVSAPSETPMSQAKSVLGTPGY